VIAVVLQAFWNLARTAAKSRWLVVIGVLWPELPMRQERTSCSSFSSVPPSPRPPLLISRARTVPLMLLLSAAPPFSAAAGAGVRGLRQPGTLFLVFAKDGRGPLRSGYVLWPFCAPIWSTGWGG